MYLLNCQLNSNILNFSSILAFCENLLLIKYIFTDAPFLNYLFYLSIINHVPFSIYSLFQHQIIFIPINDQRLLKFKFFRNYRLLNPAFSYQFNFINLSITIKFLYHVSFEVKLFDFHKNAFNHPLYYYYCFFFYFLE